MKKFCYAIILTLVNNFCIAACPKIIAHRGGAGEFPENTIEAAQRVISAGVEGVELDVQLSLDNQVVVYHSRNLNARTQADGLVADYPYFKIKKLDASFRFNQANPHTIPFPVTSVPLLSEFLSKIKDSLLIIDFKSNSIEPLVDAVIKEIDSNQAWNRVVFYSTNHKHLSYLEKRKPSAKIFEPRERTLKRLLLMQTGHQCCCDRDKEYVGFELTRALKVTDSFELGANTLNVPFKLWDVEAIQCFAQQGVSDLKVFLFGIDSEADYAQAIKLGAHAVFSNYPIKLMEYREKLKSSQH